MMNKNAVIYLGLTLSLVACADDVHEDIQSGEGGGISFSMGMAPVTRTAVSGSTAAGLLGNAFYVFGIKNETASEGADGNIVFQNYKVAFTDGTAGTSTSNTSGWEYVGQSLSADEAANLLPNSGTDPQTVKYWDANAASYTYYAFAFGNNDLSQGNVKVTKKYLDKLNVYLNGYSMKVNGTADPTQLYLACRQPVDRYGVRSSANTFGGDVTFSFRRAMAKVRVGMYETIPGYSVTIDAFRVANQTAPVFGQMTTEVTDKFAANLKSDKPGTAGTVTVTYGDGSSAEENSPLVSFDAEDSSADNVLYLGDNLKEGTVLKTSVAEAVYDTQDGAYTTVYPMAGNLNSLKLKVDFTLTSSVGETIKVTDATAEIPASYLRWQPGCAYTYIFKISDQTNATVGKLTGLHPITLDVVTVEDDDAKELISTTSPKDNNNIMTIGVDPETKTVVDSKDDYDEGNYVYASFIVDGNVVAPTRTAVNLYTATTDDPDNFPITESAVSAYVENYDNNCLLVDQHVTVYRLDADESEIITGIPQGNGSDDVLNISALRWTAARKVYVVEYIVGSSTEPIYKKVKIGGNDGETSGVLSLSTKDVTNMGADITPSVTVDGVTPSNGEVSYALDTSGDYGDAVPQTVTITQNGTVEAKVSVPAGTSPGTYTVIATYNRRTYRTTFTVSQ